jgi:hypothetical protein
MCSSIALSNSINSHFDLSVKRTNHFPPRFFRFAFGVAIDFSARKMLLAVALALAALSTYQREVLVVSALHLLSLILEETSTLQHASHV